MAIRMRAARLLLVDDNRDNLDVLAILLGDKYSVACCSSADEALRVLQSTRADVLVLDIGMAPVDGLECLQTIRAMPGYATTPAIALTAFARDVERQRFLAAGFQAVVTKPILDQQRFEIVIDSLLDATGECDTTAANGAAHDAIDRACLTVPENDGMIARRGRGEKGSS